MLLGGQFRFTYFLVSLHLCLFCYLYSLLQLPSHLYLYNLDDSWQALRNYFVL